MITIKQTHIGNRAQLSIFPTWVSNGHWAIRRDKIANDGLFASEATAKAAFPKVQVVRVHEDDTMIARIMARVQDSIKAFTLTKWTYEGDKTRFALLTVGAEHSYVSRAYLDLLQVVAGTELYATDATSALTNAKDIDDRTFILMPAVVDKTGAHLIPLISLVHSLDAIPEAKAS